MCLERAIVCFVCSKEISAYCVNPVAKRLAEVEILHQCREQNTILSLQSLELVKIVTVLSNCLPAGVLSDGIAPSKSLTWKKSGMRLTIVLFVPWFNF